MSAHAIVIGIDRYGNPENPAWRLDGAVADAIAFAEWATSAGGVAPENLTLLLSPSDTKLPDALAARVKEATIDGINETFYAYHSEKKGEGADRLWFYYAGHGLASPGDNPASGPLIVPTNVSHVGRYVSQSPIGLEVFREQMQDQPPGQQFFFVDACRDVMELPGNKSLTQKVFWDARAFAAKSTFSTQAIFLATAAGQKAKEVRGRGIFGRVLRCGLKGLGPQLAAPASSQPRPRLMFADLVTFVRQTVPVALKDASLSPDAIQVPEGNVLHFPGDLALLELDAAMLPRVTVTPVIRPAAAYGQGEIAFVRWDESDWSPVRDPKPVGPPIPEPAEFRVTGGPKRIRVRSPGYDDKITEALTIFEDKRFYIDLAPSTTRGLESLGPELGRLSVSSPDPLARVSIIDGAGKEIASKYAYLDPVDLAPGPYLVRAELTASQRSEKNVDVRPGSVETISLSIPGSAPAPPLSQALEQVGIVYRDEAFDPSENLGTMSDARLGTILACAVWAARWPPAAGFKRLRKLGADPITGLTPGMSAVQILIGDSANEAGFLDGCRAAIERGTGSPLLPGNVILISRGPAATNQALVPLSGLPQARQSSTPLPPGAYRVRIEMPGFASASFAVTLLAGFVTVFIVAREENGSVDIQQQFHPIDPTVPVLRGLPRPMLNDVRIVDLSRRALEGRDPLSDIEYGGLLERKRANPMLAIIAGYRMLGTPREDQFRGPAGTAPTPGTLGESPLWNMVAFFPGLPDVHVLAGLYDPAKRRQHFERAMAAGTPVLAEGFWRLLEWLTEKSAADKTAPPQLRQSLVPGTVWTAFAPPRPASPLGASRVVLPSGRALADAPDVRMAAAERAVGRLDVIGETGFLCSSFLVGPRTAVCPLHFALKFADEGPDGSWTIRLPTVFNVVPGSDASVRKVVRVLRTIRPPAGTDLDRGPLPRELLDQCWPVLLELDADTSPGALSISTLAAAVGQRVAVIGFPRSDVRVPPGVFAELFAGAAGEKHLMPGAVLRAAGTGPLFDYDCFTADGTSGGPVVDAATGLVLGMHVAASPVQDGRKRGMAVALSSLAAVFKDQR